MKRNVLCAAMILMAGSLLAADKDGVSAAIAKLAAADSYSWTSTNVNNAQPAGGGGRGRGGFGGFGPGSGKILKSGLIEVTTPGRGGNPATQSYVKGTNGAFPTQDGGWTSIADALKDDGGGGGGFNFGQFQAQRLLTTQPPADQAKTLLDACKSISQADGAYSGDLTDAGAKAFVQPATNSNFQLTVTDAKVSVKFWIKDGALSKYEYRTIDKTQFGDQDPMDVDRTTTVEIKDVGATKIDVPAEAKAKLPS